jgi:hypothetical protein
MSQISGQSERRSFSLLDLCILIAAIAFGLSVGISQDFRNWSLSTSAAREAVRLQFSIAVVYLAPLLLFLSVAVVALDFVSKRARRTSALLQPGVGACFMVTIATVLYMAINTARKMFYGTIYAYDIVSRGSLVSSAIMDMASRAGYFVVALWVIQVAARSRIKEVSSWVDWFGSIVGVIWIALLYSPPLKPAF